MDDKHITVNSQPVSEYVKQSEGKEGLKSLKEDQKELKKCIHPHISTKYEDQKEKPCPCYIKSLKGIRRYLMKNQNTPTVEKIFAILRSSQDMLRATDISNILETVKPNSISTTLNRLKKKMPEMFETKRIKNFLYYGLSEEGIRYSPKDLHTKSKLTNKGTAPEYFQPEEEQPPKLEAFLSEISPKEVTITITLKL